MQTVYLPSGICLRLCPNAVIMVHTRMCLLIGWYIRNISRQNMHLWGEHICYQIYNFIGQDKCINYKILGWSGSG
jgi:hypothetical protein